MQRREFLAASAAAVVAGLVGTRFGFAADAPAKSPRQYLDLRTYHFASPEKMAAFEQFLADAAVPAWNRAGLQPVGVWKPTAKDNPNLKLTADPADLYVLLPHPSMESVLGLDAKLAADEAFQKAGQAVLTAPKNNPAFARYDSTLLLSMEAAPPVQAPTKAATRVFELRTYQSHSEDRAANKLEMFNKGEFPIFGRSNMPGIFFGGAVAGANLPQLTYMVVHEDFAASKKNWTTFFADAEWKKISKEPQWKDNVSKVVSTFLRPAGGSQI